jgi:polar amino acid transport system permease protein
MSSFSYWDILRNLLNAGVWTVALSLIAFLGGGTVGLAVLFMRTSKIRALRLATQGYINLFQGTPLLMQLFLAFFGLSMLGVEVSPWFAAALALTLYASAYLAEIWRGCVEAIPQGQWESSASLAMSFFEQMRHVILPQAVRIAIPSTVGFSVQVVKGTALASIIGFVELTKASTMITNATFAPFTVYGTVAVLYFALCYPLSWYARRLEVRFNAAGSH